MAGNAFTAGVKPGGLNSSTEIRILLCYLIKNAASPLTGEELEAALLNEALVNYFEFAACLSDLCEQGLVEKREDGYHILPKGREVADTLQDDVPLTVRECASRAVVRAQLFARKSAQHKVQLEETPGGYLVHCSIEEGAAPLFQLTVAMPDKFSAKLAREQFIAHGDELYEFLIGRLTQEE